MQALGRYAGRTTVVAAWTVTVLVAAAAAAVGVTEVWPVQGATVDAEQLVTGAATAWLVGIAFVWYRERRHWRRMAADGQFELQADEWGTYPPLQSTVRGRTVTAQACAPGPLSDVHTVVATAVDGVDGPLDLTARYVGGDGAGRGIPVSNPTLARRFVVIGGPPDVLPAVFTPEAQSVLMDLDVPGNLSITTRRVAYDVPFVHLSPGECRRCANAVATVALTVERAVA